MATPTPGPGNYFVVRPKGVVPTLIAWFTRSRFAHAGLVGDGDTVIEAEPGGVRVGRLSEYDGRPIVFNTGEPTTATQRAQVIAFAIAAIGEPYNWDADVADGLATLGWHWRLLAKTAAGRKAVMCSELVVKAGQAAGLDWQCGKPTAAAVVPGDLARRLH